MPEPLDDALATLRPLLLDKEQLVRAVAAGRRRGAAGAGLRFERAELRPVDLKAGRSLQVVTTADGAPLTRNEPYGPAAEKLVDELLAEPFGNWHVQATTETIQLRVTKKGAAQLHRAPSSAPQQTSHDRAKPHLIDPGDPLFRVLGADGGKRRQVDAFLRILVAAIAEADLPDDRPLRVVDLGCGNAYLSFAAYRQLAETRDVELVGVDVRADARDRNTAIAAELGWSDRVSFVAGSILDAPTEPAEVVLALHACDTATDDALAQAVRWRSPLVLASPCCHHHLQQQLRSADVPGPWTLVTRHPILREHLGDTLTDALRAALLHRAGYRADVIAFVDAEHTARNTLIRAVRTGTDAEPGADAVYAALVQSWGLTPYLQTLLDDAGG